MISPNRLPIGEILLAEGLLTKEKLAQALAEQKVGGQYLGELLVARGFVTAEQLVKGLAKRLGVRGCQLRIGLADPAALGLIGEEEALRLKALPMFKVRQTLVVAMAEPQSLPQIDRLHQLSGCSIKPVLALEANIVEFIKKHAGMKIDIESMLSTAQENDVAVMSANDDGGIVDLSCPEENGAVVNLVNMVLLKSVRDRASDIHFEPNDASTRIRYRVDGVLHDVIQPATNMHALIISRIKVLAKMDIAEKRLPQEGRVRVSAEGREIDLRVSTMPTLLGEKIVIRILDKANLRVRLEDLGFRAQTLSAFQRVLHQPYGMVLVTGPTGSGKTTTLYSALESLRSSEVNIVTVEDPVEYQLDLINQIQVRGEIGMTFARALRSILRQDPDVIMVGEIRDNETAFVSVHAALTGHLVLATLHTNDAASAIARLSDMGVEPYLLSGALIGVVAQRLVRKICSNCATSYHPDAVTLRDAGLDDGGKWLLHRGAGCDQCQGTGYKGRMGIYEVIEVTPELRTMIHQRAATQVLRQKWQEQGGLTLRQEGLPLALNGKTTLEELLSVTFAENAGGAVPRKQIEAAREQAL
jgi:type IV pilus assembly protein PilB